MSSRADRLLCCAVAYSTAEIPEVPIPKINSSSSVEDVIQSMMNVLWFEAKENMKESMTDMPVDPYLHAVDVDSSEPGIVSSKNKSDKLDIHRRKLPLPQIRYEKRKPVEALSFENIFADISPEDAVQKAEKESAKKIKQSQNRACKELKNETASLQKIEDREERKKKRESETIEERELRLAEQREKRAKKKEEKRIQDELNAIDVDTKEASTEANKTGKEGEEDEKKDEGDIYVEKKLQNTNDVQGDDADAESKMTDVAINIQEMLEIEASADALHHSIMPQRVKARSRKTKFHPSPVPFDRHLLALEAAYPCSHVKDAFIDLIPDDRIHVIQGPPGTGKTTELLKRIDLYPKNRIFICAGTNVGAANLYTRLVLSGKSCSLLMPQSRIPPGTPITSQDPCGRIVCSTISGRSGPVLDSQKFDVIFVDEAAQCMEAWFWGLIRPEVEHIIMVGDTNQLPALVSEKGKNLGHSVSLMQRLVETGYPYKTLTVQRRMHPEIVKYPNIAFYGNKLKTEYESISVDFDPYIMYDIDSKCDDFGTSFVNHMEAEFCVLRAKELKEYFNEVVIICPYQGQARQILSLGPDVPVHTIDSFQGREADAIIVSIVRTDTCGFWSDERRLCVALTRAKHHLSVVGNGSQWVDPLKSLYLDAKQRNLVKKI